MAQPLDAETPDLPVGFAHCRLLMALEKAATVTDIAGLLQRHPSVVSRRLAELAALAPVVARDGARWKLTPLGVRLCRWARAAAAAQRGILEGGERLCLAGEGELLRRLFDGALRALPGAAASIELRAASTMGSLEAALTSGLADFALAAERPRGPQLRHRVLGELPFVAVATPAVAREGEAAPYLENLSPIAVPRAGDARSGLRSDSLAVIGDACRRGLGWALLPSFCVRADLASGALVALPGIAGASAKLSLWWLAESDVAKRWAPAIARALGEGALK